MTSRTREKSLRCFEPDGLGPMRGGSAPGGRTTVWSDRNEFNEERVCTWSSVGPVYSQRGLYMSGLKARISTANFSRVLLFLRSLHSLLRISARANGSRADCSRGLSRRHGPKRKRVPAADLRLDLGCAGGSRWPAPLNRSNKGFHCYDSVRSPNPLRNPVLREIRRELVIAWSKTGFLLTRPYGRITSGVTSHRRLMRRPRRHQ